MILDRILGDPAPLVVCGQGRVEMELCLWNLEWSQGAGARLCERGRSPTAFAVLPVERSVSQSWVRWGWGLSLGLTRRKCGGWPARGVFLSYASTPLCCACHLVLGTERE